MPNLSIKNVPEDVVAKLRQRAADHHRSLQGELLDLVCRAAEPGRNNPSRTEQGDESSGWLTIEEVAKEVRPPRRKATSGRPLAVDIIRQERDRR